MLTARRRSAWMRLLAPAVVAAALLVPDPAQAGEGSSDADVQSSWRLPPPSLRLQPEAARLFINLPPEWMPPREHGRLGPFEFRERLIFVRELQSSGHVAASTLGAALRFELEDRARSLGFGLTVLPRAAVAVLRFDPLPPQLR